MDFQSLMQEFVNKDYEELLDLAKQAIAYVLPVCKKVDPDNDGIGMLSAILLSAVAADGKLTALEAKFLGDITGLDAQGLDKLTKLYSGRMDVLTNALADAGSKELKSNICILISCLAACDETITHEENEFIREILA